MGHLGYVGEKVRVIVDGNVRYGTVVETQPAVNYGGLIQQEPRHSAVRVWLDGEKQPEQHLRKPDEVGW